MSAMVRGKLALAVVLAVATQGLGSTTAHADGPNPSQRASLYAKASVVRVVGYWEVTFSLGDRPIPEFVGGTGSGFFASADGFVVTNAHVVEQIHEGAAKAKEAAFLQLAEKLNQKFSKELAAMSDAEKRDLVRTLMSSATAVPNAFIVLPDGTKLDYTIKAYGKPGAGSDVAVIKVDIKAAPNLAVADSDQVQIQDRVLAIGYPGAADMQGLLDDKSQLEASINEGAVSALKRTGAGEPIIQISASITHGNSGGPTINEAGDVIGLSTFGSKGEVQGFNFIVASTTVTKFLAEAKANTAPSATIKAWRKGLEELWALDLDAAISDFEEVLTLFPVHSEAPRLSRQARQLKKDGKGKPPVAAALAASTPSSGSATLAAAPGGTSTMPSMAATTTPGGSGGGAAAGITVALVVVGLAIGGVIMMKKQKPVAARPPGVQPPHAPHPGMPGIPPGHPGPPGHHAGHAHAGAGLHPAQHGHGPPHLAPHAMLTPGRAGSPHMPPQAMMMPGRNGPAPVAKTVAIGAPPGNDAIAKTAFGAFTLGTLTCSRGLLLGQRFSLTAQGLLIGRQPGVAQIIVNDARASGKHVWIGYEQGQLVAVDQGTTNGTFVNDVRLGRISRAFLKDGDTVIVSEPDCLSLTIKLS